MDLVLPFWNFIVGELTGVIEETLDIPDGQDCLFGLIFIKIVYYFIHLFI